jgi:hypothetical protein
MCNLCQISMYTTNNLYVQGYGCMHLFSVYGASSICSMSMIFKPSILVNKISLLSLLKYLAIHCIESEEMQTNIHGIRKVSVAIGIYSEIILYLLFSRQLDQESHMFTLERKNIFWRPFPPSHVGRGKSCHKVLLMIKLWWQLACITILLKKPNRLEPNGTCAYVSVWNLNIPFHSVFCSYSFLSQT